MIVAVLLAAAAAAATAGPPLDSAYAEIEREYVLGFLRRNPVVSTSLGGSALDPTLSDIDGALRDWSPEALAAEAKFHEEIRVKLEAIDPARLEARHRIDREIIFRQIAFLRRTNMERKLWRRAVDTYMDEAFRGLHGSLQGMAGPGGGAEADWRRVIERVSAVPGYLKTAQANLEAGLAARDAPDWRMVETDGLEGAARNAAFLEKELPAQAASRLKGQPSAPRLLADLKKAGVRAAAACRDFRAFLERSLAALPKDDRFAIGEAEYDWALRNNLGLETSSGQLFDESTSAIEATRGQLIATARRIAVRRDIGWDDANRDASTRAVIDRLRAEPPRTEEEMLRSYREVGRRLVEFGRKAGLFDVAADYEVTQGALERLETHNPAAMASLVAREGFPGKGWHRAVMAASRDRLSPVRWLTPGEVEGSTSMWLGSVAAEGWGAYAESLMGEAAAGFPGGIYTDEERLYQLRGQLHRDLGVRLDTGLHTGRLPFDEAVDLLSATLDFLPGSCRAADLPPAKKESCRAARGVALRCSKWPTRAVTHRLGQQQILDLRAKAEKVAPGPEGRRRFHLLLMKQGTIPAAFFEEDLLAELKR